jgi:hypothetical protein
VLHGAIGAWQVGATGRNVTIAIIDTGLDSNNPEFAGRISAASADVAGRRSIIPENPHGTNVALVAAAARNDIGVMGIAYEATILALRADAPGSCASGGCGFTSTAVVAGFNRAIANGAKVINLSMGGSAPSTSERNAVVSAANAGIVVVVAAGNSGTSQADPFGAGLRAAGNGNVIIAGSVSSSGVISSFSNRAGAEANWYLSAVGQSVCCTYRNGAPTTSTFSGTSFSTPQIAGAVALLRQAFPNLTATQTVNLLLTTARDAGAVGVDEIYGRGIMDITNAFAPQGTLSLAGTSAPLQQGTTTGTTSTAMGDAGRFAPLSAVMLDSYSRAYRIQLGGGLQAARADPRLGQSLLNPIESVTGGVGRLSLGFSVDRRGRLAGSPWQGKLRLGRADAEVSRVLAGRVAARLAPETNIAFGFAQGADGLIAQVQGHSEPAFFVVRSLADDFGFTRADENSVALRQQFGRLGLTVSGARARVAGAGPTPYAGNGFQSPSGQEVTRFSVSADRRFGELATALTASWLAEDRTMLGARLHDAFGLRGADSLFIDARAAWRPAPEWQLAAAWRQGFTRARLGGQISNGSQLTSSAWSLDIERSSLFAADDSLALRLSQPLRVQSGGLALYLPVAWDYATLSATNAISTLSLRPSGRELDAELAWRGPLWGGSASASLFWRRNPDHVAVKPADAGAAVSWKTQF